MSTMDESAVVSEGSKAISEKSSNLIDNVVTKGKAVVNTIFPPEKRAQWWSSFQNFAISNPKVTFFLLTNLVLSGPPLFLFILFSVTVFLVSLIAALLIGVLAALLFTVFMLLVALFIVLPTLFLTTFAAMFIFLWGLGGYFIVKWFNDGETPAKAGQAVADTLNSITGGKLNWATDALGSTPLSNVGAGQATKAVSSKGSDPAAGKTSDVAAKSDKVSKVEEAGDDKPEHTKSESLSTTEGNGLSSETMSSATSKSTPTKLRKNAT